MNRGAVGDTRPATIVQKLKPPLRLIGLVRVAGAFAIGAALVLSALVLRGPEVEDVGNRGLLLVLAIPLTISPFIYIAGFLFQEAVLPPRSRFAQLTSATACGAGYVLLLAGASMLGSLSESDEELPAWILRLTLVVLWMSGPLVVAIVSSWVERRISRAPKRKEPEPF